MPSADVDIIGPLLAHFEGLFPKTCACGRTFATLGEYIRDTARTGDTISYDAGADDWVPAQPVGTLALANCRCGSTIALSTDGIPLATRHLLLAWVKAEKSRRGVTSEVVVDDLREEIRKRALSDSARPS